MSCFLFILHVEIECTKVKEVHQELSAAEDDPNYILPKISVQQRKNEHVEMEILFWDYRNKIETKKFAQCLIDIRYCEPNYSTEHTKSPLRLKYWFRIKGKLSDDQALHRCALAFFGSFVHLCQYAPSPQKGIWFHRPVRADDWLLIVIVSPMANESGGFAIGEMFNRKGELVISLTQEALLKESATPKSTFGSKL